MRPAQGSDATANGHSGWEEGGSGATREPRERDEIPAQSHFHPAS